MVCQITEVTVTPLAYVTNNATRIKVKAVGDLNMREPSAVSAAACQPHAAVEGPLESAAGVVGGVSAAAQRDSAPGKGNLFPEVFLEAHTRLFNEFQT